MSYIFENLIGFAKIIFLYYFFYAYVCLEVRVGLDWCFYYFFYVLVFWFYYRFLMYINDFGEVFCLCDFLSRLGFLVR